ncbi:bifunctional metallophosphatase/5'-nucleotidase [Methylobrevis albus]|uniref:5'-nucleotidase C-terminal domain-containing protein n=1 Tax=Methylobrevis albus TaxID=2793297 RepID=A0A931I664_9HYPH|nr:5'-nucleotidase C-terminal domain-containing protein [Methylobrevis albus]MBH0239548.1 5'-nucleotidase C-terminal domain-containing protein [Methylobrevis albus]
MTLTLLKTRRAAALVAAAGLVLAAALLPAAARAEPVTLRFVQTNDIDRMEEDDGRGGFARLAGVLAAERAKDGTTFFVHSGDSISPSLLSGIDRGVHIIDILNRMDVTVMVPGNHEFDFGPEVFRERMAEKTFDVVASNIREADGSAPAHTIDDKIIEVGGLKIAFYGLTTEETPVVATARDVTFASSIETARAKSAALKEAGADFVVAVVHTPLVVDMMLVRERLADLVLSGHDEHLITYYDGRTALTESYSQADFVVVTEIAIEKSERDGRTRVAWSPRFEVIDTATVEPDAAIAAVVKGYEDKLDAELQVEIGTTETALDSRRATVRTQEAAIGNLIADATRQAVGADIGITNGGGIRADKEYAAGTKLTRGDILAELPFGNKTVKLEVTGAAVKAALENGFSQVREVAGRFPQVSGLKVTAKLGNPVGERVTAVEIGGAPLDPAKVYTVATNDYMALGGDGYRAFVGATNLVDAVDATLMASQVIDYIAAAGNVAPAVEGRIVLE